MNSFEVMAVCDAYCGSLAITGTVVGFVAGGLVASLVYSTVLLYRSRKSLT